MKLTSRKLELTVDQLQLEAYGMGIKEAAIVVLKAGAEGSTLLKLHGVDAAVADTVLDMLVEALITHEFDSFDSS